MGLKKTAYDKMEECAVGCNLEKHSSDSDWQIRYSAAIGMGERKDAKWLSVLEQMIAHERNRPLYTQPPASFPGKPDDQTRLSEHIGPLEVVFDKHYDEETKDAWLCRGRVMQAILYAIYDIGSTTDNLLSLIHGCLDEKTNDLCIIAAAARTLGKVGDLSSMGLLEKLMQIDEWCTATEAKKSILLLKGRYPLYPRR
jgi:HEAT repeat protein